MKTKTVELLANGTLNESALESYLDLKYQEITDFLEPQDLSAQRHNYRRELDRHFGRLESFWHTAGKNAFSQLVLGRVQSGKTSHMEATLAYAADQNYLLSAMATGTSIPLFAQSWSRLRKNLPSRFIEVWEVPTSRTAQDDFERRIRFNVSRRNKGLAPISPMPVLLTLKNPRRISVLARILRGIHEEFPDGRLLLIDDEADQASPNTPTTNRELSATHKALSQSRAGMGRHIYLSYTATPQALLLAPLINDLRPDRCLVVDPSSGYFGLDDLLALPSGNRQSVEEHDLESLKQGLMPPGLHNALFDFFFTGMMLQRNPNLFWYPDKARPFPLNPPKSFQMLIHPDPKTAIHKNVEKLVEDFRIRLQVQFDSDREHLINALAPYYLRWHQSLPQTIAKQVADKFSDQDLVDFIRIAINQTEILKLNSTSSSTLQKEALPQEQREWDLNPLWIVIGGNMLGRGVTLPNLLSTYILRNPKVKLFDTTKQQMRFCGYRAPYRHLVKVWAPPTLWEAYREMNDIDSAVIARARVWDKQDQPLAQGAPRVLYISRSNNKINPTRKQVLDPNLKDKTISSDQIFVSRRLGSPRRLTRNLQIIKSLWQKSLKPLSAELPGKGGWVEVKNPPIDDVCDLFNGWGAFTEDKDTLHQLAEMFSDNLGSLSLAQFPISILVKDIHAILEASNWWCSNEVSSRRTVANFASLKPKEAQAIYETWQKRLTNNSLDLSEFDNMMFTFGGDTQRNIVKKMSQKGLFVILQPLNLQIKRQTIARDIALGLFTTVETKLRILGPKSVNPE